MTTEVETDREKEIEEANRINDVAKHEGWTVGDVSTNDGLVLQLMKIDFPEDNNLTVSDPFETDQDAWQHVCYKAFVEGRQLHLDALKLVRTSKYGQKEWDSIKRTMKEYDNYLEEMEKDQ